MKRALLLAPGILFAGCAPAGSATDPVAAGTPSPHAFEVHLTLTPRAADQLAASGERVIVDAMYFGEAVSADALGVDEHGVEVGLGSDQIEVDPVNALVKAPGTGFDDTNIASIKGEPQVLVNVYSARRTHTDNLLSCGPYQGPVAMAQKLPVAISCDLIEAPPELETFEPVWLISNCRLMFGLPNSGNITITFACAPGGNRVKIETHNPGTDGAHLFFASGAVSKILDAKRAPPDGEWIAADEVVSVAELSLSDPVLHAFRSSGALSKGAPALALRTATADEMREIEAFFASCER